MKYEIEHNDNRSSNTVKFLVGILTIAFVVLKLCKVIAWKWIWVLSPLWIYVAIVLIVVVIMSIVVVVHNAKE